MRGEPTPRGCDKRLASAGRATRLPGVATSGSLRRVGRRGLKRERRTALLGAPRVARTGQGTGRSSELRAPHLAWVGNQMLFGASGPPPHGTGTPRLFGRTDTPSPAIGRPTCLQARRPVAERQDLSPGGTAPSTGRGERLASAGRAARRAGPRLGKLFGVSRDGLIGTGNPALFGARSPPSHVEPELFGRTAPIGYAGVRLSPRRGVVGKATGFGRARSRAGR
jgi:hypothetical protein